MNDRYTWVLVFKDIASKLLEFKNDRKKLLDIMYEILIELNLFNDKDDKNCNLDSFNGVRCKYDDFDPFSFMNRLALYSEENRKKFIMKFQEKTCMPLNIPNDFDGVPTVDARLSCMLQFKDDRKLEDVNDFWNFFEVAYRLPEDSSLKNEFIKYYDLVMKKPNCSFNLTSCLFRMNGLFYISLDSTNRNYINNKLSIDISKCPTGEEYLNILDTLKEYIMSSDEYDSIPDFSYKAWMESKNKKKVWLYSPGEQSAYWNDCIRDNIMVLGWDELGDLSNCTSYDYINDQIKKIYNQDNPVMSKCAVGDFVNAISVGDIVIAKKGVKTLLGYGEVVSDYYFDNNRECYKHCRKVSWKKIGEWINSTDTLNPVKTLTEISKYVGYPEELLSIINEEGDIKMDSEINYYWLNARPKFWSFSNIKVGETINYTSINHNGNKRSVYRNFVSIKPGDKVIAYESTPVKSIVGLCDVVSSLDKNGEIVFKKIEQFNNPIPYSAIKDIPGLQNMEYLRVQQGSLFKLEQDEYDLLMEIIRDENSVQVNNYPKYNETKFLNDIYIDKSKFIDIKNLLDRKMNIVLQGAPGVGKTYMAKKIAYALMGEENDERIEFVQFHQSYSYEDFIEGYRPTEDGSFELTKGVFYNFCVRAKNDPEKDYYMIIDEINRGNLSKIFGELLMLIEKDKREKNLTLAYSKTKFSVPKNLYIIGMMNTADRSLAILDYALRRRFSFIDINPAFDNNVFKNYQRGVNNVFLDKTIENIKKLNVEISNDITLGKGFVIGHSYFCGLKSDVSNSDIKLIIKYEIIPLLREYWFDEEEKADKWEKALLGA